MAAVVYVSGGVTGAAPPLRGVSEELPLTRQFFWSFALQNSMINTASLEIGGRPPPA
jgi:hypothetical protein